MQMQNKASVFFLRKKYMKTKKYITVKILCFALSGLLLSSSVFFSNQKAIAVYAMTDEQEDLAYKVITAICTIIGVVPIPGSKAVAVVAEACGIAGIALIDFIQDNGDGTYTIDTELVQAVNEIICNDYIDGQVEPDENGLYNYGAYSVKLSHVYGSSTNDISLESTSFQYDCPLVAVLTSTWSDSTTEGATFYIYGLRDGSTSVVTSFPSSFEGEQGSSTYYQKYSFSSNITNSTSHALAYANGKFTASKADNTTTWSLTYSIPFPVFSDVTTAQNALISGDYTDAINYRAKTFETSSRFTGLPYTGGDITVTYNVLNGIEDKITELDETDKTTDEKINELQDYINSTDNVTSGDSVSGGDSGGSSDDDSGGGFLSKLSDFFGKILDFILSLVEKLFDPILKLLDMFMELINKVIDIVPTGFTSFLGAMFPFFPVEWSTIISFGLLAFVIIGLIFRRK